MGNLNQRCSGCQRKRMECVCLLIANQPRSWSTLGKVRDGAAWNAGVVRDLLSMSDGRHRHALVVTL